MKKNVKRVAIAMSGGVDSSVAAALLKKEGYDCIGIFMRLWSDSDKGPRDSNRCCSLESSNDARSVAYKLNIPIYVLNFKNDFKKLIVKNFINEYQSGKTPNPCIQCNKLIKFDLLLKKALALGCDYLATGHYIKKIEIFAKGAGLSGRRSKVSYRLLMANDTNKDQSYFLYNLTQKQLPYLLFPLGEYTKPKVRQMAKKFGLIVHNKAESQEICFIADKNPDNFLKKNIKMKPGLIITTDDKKIGYHQGLPLYTLGQRRGIGIGGIGPFYVTNKDNKKNLLIVSNNRNDLNLFNNCFYVSKINWIDNTPKFPFYCEVKIRYQSPSIRCKIFKEKNFYRIELDKPLRAITLGQSAVFYQNNVLLGGGIIK